VATTAGRVKERRLERMRLGQAVCDFVALPSDPKKSLADNGLERTLWQIMVRTETLPWVGYASATYGQLTWVFLNTTIDYDERVRKIHTHCLPEFRKEVCEVCHKPIVNHDDLPPEIREKIYRPSEHETYHKEIVFEHPPSGMPSEEVEVDEANVTD
jgi:hypothetical protein